MNVEVIFFELRGRRCALPVSVVREVLALSSLTPVPLAPSVIRGATPVHGQVVPLLDLGVWLGPQTDTRVDASTFRASDKALLVEVRLPTENKPVRVALSVDRTMQLGTIEEDHARPPPAGPAFVKATLIDIDGPALLIDIEKALEGVRDAVAAAVRS